MPEFLESIGRFLSQNVIKPVGGYIESLIKPVREKGFKGVLESVGKVAGDIGNVIGTVADIAKAVKETNIPGLSEVAGVVETGARTGKSIAERVKGVSGGISAALP